MPRIHRGGQFLLLRGLTTVILRDLNVTIVADQLTRGTPVVYVDFVDYDEVAHHAGPTRPESLRTLENLDRVLGSSTSSPARSVAATRSPSSPTTARPRARRSSSSPGAPRETVHGAVRGARSAATTSTPSETSIPATVLLAGATGTGQRGGPAPPARSRRTEATRPRDRRGDETRPSWSSRSPAAWPTSTAPASPGRLTRERLDELHPRLVRGLAEARRTSGW